ncbi:uncharacterized protein LOC114316521 isoform X2 [Camellia sinensis]|uniref:uncharacterized protein LOC114316521 isoform X2 n=2 Tax=Camellia sinensis TaxID=4442 RepID=UPI001035B331|nr:uncharacterized protein LOC114316521 isoform X2 [Camellia sinensis]
MDIGHLAPTMGRKRLKTIAEQHIQMSDTIAGSCRKRPVAPFICYSQQQFKEMQGPDNTRRKMPRKEIGERWKALPSDEKKRFVEMAKASAEEHAKVVPCAPKSEKGKRQLRISLKSIVELVNRFNEAQKQAVIDIGFAGLLGMKCTRIDHDLCAWLVQNFDPDSSSLNVHGCQVRLTCKAVNVLLGIRCEGDDVQLAGSLEAYPNIYDEVGVVNGVIPLNKLRLYLTETAGAEDEFRRKFALYVLGAMLCPTTMTGLKPSFIHAVKDVNRMRACNWAKLTLQFLHNGVRKYKGHRGATGCVFLLMDSLTMLDSEGLLSAEEQKLLHYVFDDSKNEMDIVVSMNLHGRACEVGTRRDMRTLKPGSWLSDTPINLVVVQLTNRQRDLHNDGRHTDWFFPVYLSTMILNKDMQPLDHEHIVTSFFGHDRYTGAIDACQRIYVPFNYRGVHWLCVKIDMVDRVAYLFDSVPSNRPNKRKLNAAKILVETMHDLLQLHFGNDYVTDVRTFHRCMLDERPVQQLDDTFDCGMFVIKFMQQPDLSPGPHKTSLRPPPICHRSANQRSA